MQYEDPLITDNVNVSQESPAKTFIKLLTALVIIIITVYLILSASIYHLVKYIPFEYEKRLFEPLTQSILSGIDDKKYPEKVKSLQSIADKLVSNAQKSPETQSLMDIPITMHYSDGGDVNAFATLGGHIVVSQGLISVMENENTLAMVIGHEIGHVMHRDALRSLGRVTLTNLLIASVLGIEANSIAGQSTSFLEYSYSRQDEHRADKIGLTLLHNTYSNAYGAARLFELFSVIQPSKSKWIELSSTHPLPVNRKAHVESLIKLKRYQQERHTTLPLPTSLRTDPNL